MSRSVYFDLLRMQACLMIVCMHSPLPSGEGNGVFLSLLSYLTAPGVGLFFMVSGALLLPVKTDVRIFLKRRFTKIVVPAVIWTLFFLGCDAWFKGETITLRNILSMPFSAQGNPVFWFIYTLLGLYLLAPILSRWLVNCSRRELEFYICLWVISLCYPLLRYFVDINTSNTGILYYFTGYVGYFVLGYYCRSYPTSFSMRWLVPAIMVAMAVPVFCKLRGLSVDFYAIFWYLSPFVVVQCLFWWKSVSDISAKWMTKKSYPVLSTVAQLTFGIYLVHIFFMRYVLWHCDFILGIQPYILQTFVIAALTFVCSLLFCWFISLMPFSKYLIGYTKRKL